jgi:hypothetical protein
LLATGGRPSRWFDRCRGLLVPLTGCTVVRADTSTGVHHLVAEVRSIRQSIIWLKLDDLDADDPVSVGNKFALAFSESVGSSVFGLGVPIGHTVMQLHRIHSLFGPLVVVVSAGQKNVEAVHRIRSLAELGSSVCIIVPEATSDRILSAWAPSRVLEARELFLTSEEAVDLASGAIPPDDVPELLACCQGRFAAFVAAVRSTAGLPPVLEPEPNGFSLSGDQFEQLPAGLLVSSLRRRGASMEAFEVCVRLAPELAGDVIAEAAAQYVGNGLSKRLLRQLELIPHEILERSDELLRWWFAVHTSENRHATVRSTVERVLAIREAPELRALYAAAFPSPDLVKETSRAVLALETPVTLRMHGFALGQQSAGTSGMAFLMKALRLAEALGDVDQVVAAATDISNFNIRKGQYHDGAEWAKWALEHYYKNGGRDELRRLAAVSLLLFVKLLTNDLVGAESLAEQLQVSDDLLGTPTSEGMVSTVGDWHAVRGEHAAAEVTYRRSLEALPREHYHLVALDLIPVLKRLGKSAEARSIGHRARTITRASDGITAALGLLASSLSESDFSRQDAEAALEETISVLGDGSEAHRLAQACMALASMRLERGDIAGAIRALDSGYVGLRELGVSGWHLLAPRDSDVARLRALLLGDGDQPQARLSLLGASGLRVGQKEVRLTSRNAECLSVIASRPEGVTLDQLTIHLYGERGSTGTAKALVSRLRSTIPLTSRPYKIGVPVRADFLELIEHLKRGRVRQALSLYRGQLLPESVAPAIVELREQIDESLRQAVLRSGDAEAMLELVNRTDAGDLELLEEAYRHLPKNDPQSPLLRARIRQVRRDWAAEGRLTTPAEW